jgi:hypothetical protein
MSITTAVIVLLAILLAPILLIRFRKRWLAKINIAVTSAGHIRRAIPVYRNELRCASTFRNTSSRVPFKIRIFTSVAAVCPAATEVTGSTCWQVSSGLLHTLPVVRVKLATTHFRSAENVAISGSSTARDLL